MSKTSGNNILIFILLVVILGLGGYIAYPYIVPHEKTTGEKIDDALNAVSDRAEKVGKALEGK